MNKDKSEALNKPQIENKENKKKNYCYALCMVTFIFLVDASKIIFFNISDSALSFRGGNHDLPHISIPPCFQYIYHQSSLYFLAIEKMSSIANHSS